MYEHHRKSFYRDDDRDFGEDRFEADRWREEGRGRRGAYGGDRTGREPGDRNAQGAPGYFGSRGDDDERFRRHGSAFGNETHGGEQRGHWAHDARHAGRDRGASSYGYGSGQPYGGGEGDSRYFTGQQGSWAVRSPYGARGGGSFGADYRDHGYASAGGRYGERDDDDRGFWDRASDEVASWFGDEDAARRREQDHRGRGPKDYIRSDERIRDDANDRLTDDPRVDASHITVAVENGEITLNGSVASRQEKRRAEDCVERISGVKHVQNNLRVQQTDASGAYEGNWALNRTSSAEGGGLSGPSVDGSATASAKTP